MWVFYALSGAFFAAVTSIFAKLGLRDVNASLATAIRTVVVLIMAWGIVLFTGGEKGLPALSQRSWLFLILSGVSTGLSWLFFYRALQLGEASKVIPLDKLSLVISMALAFVFLKEQAEPKTVVGGLLIVAGTIVLIV